MQPMSAPVTHARCACGQVELEARGAPIIAAVCYCDDCQAGGRQIEALSHAPAVLDADSGARYILYRKDRLRTVKGLERLRPYKLKPASPTTRYVASCCNSAMYLDFAPGHWFSAYWARFEEPLPPIEMRLQARYRPGGAAPATDAPTYRTIPLRFMSRLMGAWFAKLIGQ